MKIVLCASADFYKHMNQVADELEKLGHTAVRPKASEEGAFQRDNDGSESYKDWHKDLIDTHFKEIEDCDAILVVNDQKHGRKGYIGANVMMEITIAYYLGKKVFILEDVTADNPVYDEIMAIRAVVLSGSLAKLT